jgi:Peptidase family S51
VLELTGCDRPRSLYLPTAAADDDALIIGFYERFSGRAEAAYLKLFGAPAAADWRPRLLQQDLIYVSGGNTANALAIWRAHGVDVALREAWERGVVLCGGSADVLLTFVTSALAYTTNRVGVAWSIGTKMITQTWPASAAYTFVPPITLLAFATLNPVRFPAPVVVLLAVISTLIGLLVKGAIAAFYLRHAALPTTGGQAQLRA